MAFTNPSVSNFQSYFFRDFPYSADYKVGVTDMDIANAYQMTNININQGLFVDQGSYTLGYLLMAAHYMCLNLRTSSQGINGQYNWIQQSKSVQGVAESFQIPERLAKNVYWVMLTKTNYGSRFIELVYPQLSGAMFSSYMPARAI